MGDKKSDVLQGTLGFDGVKDAIRDGATARLREDWIASKWGTSENNRRARFYSITRQGAKQLEHETENWERIAAVIGRVLRLER
jgi:hypothetical protein